MTTVGIDLVHIPTFEQKVINNGEIFLSKIFSPTEKADKDSTSTLAGKFAAKEAFIKSINPPDFELKEIQVLKEDNKPYILFRKTTYKGVSISHDGEYAIAIVIS